MEKSLSTFMIVAAVAAIMGFLILGIVFDGLSSKSEQHQDVMKTEHQLKFNN